jgi:hypothetical protein
LLFEPGKPQQNEALSWLDDRLHYTTLRFFTLLLRLKVTFARASCRLLAGSLAASGIFGKVDTWDIRFWRL